MFPPEVLWGVGALLLLIALIYGMIQYQTRNRANDPISEKGAKAQYDDPDVYPEIQEALENEVERAGKRPG
jgi:hypothetical protein